MTCDLCNLEKKTKWYYEDDFFIVCDCKKCHVPMIVLKRHDTELILNESKRLIELLMRFAEGKRIRFKRRSIPSHFHLHISDKVSKRRR